MSKTIWPRETRAEMDAFFGRHLLGPDGRPTSKWQSEHLTRIVLPYPMVLSWDTSQSVTRLLCHWKVADSLSRVLASILSHYGSIEAVRAARMHLFGGCYNYRAVRGAATLSTHAYGAGIDLDPEGNPLGATEGRMPLAVVKIFEDEGWKWGGRFKTRKDWMHFQAVR